MQPTLNQHNDNFMRLQAVYKDCEALPKCLLQKNMTVTPLLHEKKLYAYFDKPFKNAQALIKFFTDFAKTNHYNVTIDICSFKTDFCIKNKLELIAETVLVARHKAYSLKNEKKCDKKEEAKGMCDSQCLKIEKVQYNFETLPCQKACPTEEKQAEFIKQQECFLKSALVKSYYINFARKMQDLPPNIGTAEYIADCYKAEADKIDGLKITILKQKDMEALKMDLALSVNAGSKNEPRLVVAEYCSDEEASKQPKLALVGKGITFDTGGYNLKPSPFMVDMKYDMSGSAVAISTVMAIAKAGLKANVVGVTVLVENAIGTIPSAIVKSMNGKTVQIDNTDAEGRLTLADAVTYAIREKKADKLITIATLTGAIVIALGLKRTGAFSNCCKYYKKFEKAACCSHELVWRMPLGDEYHEELKQTPIADLSNIGVTRWGGASQAGAFIENFCEDKPLIHLDIAGTANEKHRGTAPMLKTIFQLVKCCTSTCDTQTCE